MKYSLIILFLQLFMTENVFAEDNCYDSSKLYYNIVQKIDDHLYEVAVDPHFGDLHLLLKTKRAIFNKPGWPIGIKIAKTSTGITVALKNGFSARYPLIKECGIVLLPPRNKRAPNPTLSVRQELKEDLK